VTPAATAIAPMLQITGRLTDLSSFPVFVTVTRYAALQTHVRFSYRDV
jgi:hypothetical protein